MSDLLKVTKLGSGEVKIPTQVILTPQPETGVRFRETSPNNFWEFLRQDAQDTQFLSPL